MSQTDWWTEHVIKLNEGTKAIVLGVLLGVVAGIIGLGIVIAEPLYMIGGVVGLLLGLYILTDLEVALYAMASVIFLLPFGTLPFKIVVTPSFLDLALVAFLMVYLFQWMTGRRRLLQLTPVHGLVLAFALILVFSFVMGLGHAILTNNILKQFVEMLLGISLAFVLVDVIRDEAMLHRFMIVLMLLAGATAFVGLFLYVLPDFTAEFLLVRFGRFGYPNGGVIRYVEDNPALAERAIGMWVDPNAYGGVLAVLGALLAPQIFAEKPVVKQRWLVTGIVGLVGLVLLLTFSRGAMMSLAVAIGFVAVMRYRRLLWLMLAAAILILLLPATQGYVVRLIEGFQMADKATQMRIGEINDALTLIGRYPLFGVGFAGTPTRDIYLGVANLYLTMAGNTGFIGLGMFLLTMLALFLYGLRAWVRSRRLRRFEAYWLGTHAAMVAALVAGVFDHYFFKLEFQASSTLFWLMFGLALAVSSLWLKAALEEPDEVYTT